MHDLHLANKILSHIIAAAQKNNLKKVTKVKLELGNICEHGETINISNLKFHLKELAKKRLAPGLTPEFIRGIEIKKVKGDNFWKLDEIEGE